MSKEVDFAYHEQVKSERWKLLEQLISLTDKPMLVLSFVWLGLLIIDLTVGLNPLLQLLSNITWLLFGLDFLIKFIIAPHKLVFLRNNLLTVISLALPALRIVRLFQAFRLLQLTRATRSITLIRLITSLNRGMKATNQVLGRRGIGYVIAFTLLVIFAGAAAMAQFESPTALQSEGLNSTEGLKSYGEAVWWTAMIMTTMGSEYWPKTVEGRILGWMLSLYAFAIFGYITATIASVFVGRDKNRSTEDEIAVLRQEIAGLKAQISALTSKLDLPHHTDR